jgi:hypothetical protein
VMAACALVLAVWMLAAPDIRGIGVTKVPAPVPTRV